MKTVDSSSCWWMRHETITIVLVSFYPVIWIWINWHWLRTHWLKTQIFAYKSEDKP